ncbi:MAG: hypothetical protein Q9202_001838 [Teloschistes flavicans]
MQWSFLVRIILENPSSPSSSSSPSDGGNVLGHRQLSHISTPRTPSHHPPLETAIVQRDLSTSAPQETTIVEGPFSFCSTDTTNNGILVCGSVAPTRSSTSTSTSSVLLAPTTTTSTAADELLYTTPAYGPFALTPLTTAAAAAVSTARTTTTTSETLWVSETMAATGAGWGAGEGSGGMKGRAREGVRGAVVMGMVVVLVLE